MLSISWGIAKALAAAKTDDKTTYKKLTTADDPELAERSMAVTMPEGPLVTRRAPWTGRMLCCSLRRSWMRRWLVAPSPSRPDAAAANQLCVIQRCLEGQISSDPAMSSLKRGHHAKSDLICESTVSRHALATLAGSPAVRLVVHRDVQSMGYGMCAAKLLTEHFASGKVKLDEKAYEDIGDEMWLIWKATSTPTARRRRYGKESSDRGRRYHHCYARPLNVRKPETSRMA